MKLAYLLLSGFQTRHMDISQVLIVHITSFAAELSPLNLDRLQTWIDEGRLDTSKPITLKELSDSRCLHGVKADGVKLLARVCLKCSLCLL